MMLNQDEILSLLFVSTNKYHEVSMKEIHEFLDLYTENGNEEETYHFYMPMHDDFNLDLFNENNDGNFYITNPKSKLVKAKIEKIVLNIIKKDNGSIRTMNTIQEYKKIFEERKMVEEKNNNENSISKIKKFIFKNK